MDFPTSGLGEATPAPRFDTWLEQARYKARVLEDQLFAVRRYVEDADGDEAMLDALSAPIRGLIQQVYAEELPMAEADVSADLMLHYTGPALEAGAPSISLLTRLFTETRAQVRNIALAVSHVTDQRPETSFDLSLSVYGRGSLYIGFSLPSPDSTLLGEGDPLIQAAREALRALGAVSREITDESSAEELEDAIPNPAVRDAALQAVRQIAPSQQSGIESVRLGGRGLTIRPSRPLTPATRGEAQRRLQVSRPRQTSPELRRAFVGTIREIDLDDRRLNLRRIESDVVERLRCVYTSEFDGTARDWLDQRVVVHGTAELDRDGVPRLLHIADVTPA